MSTSCLEKSRMMAVDERVPSSRGSQWNDGATITVNSGTWLW